MENQQQNEERLTKAEGDRAVMEFQDLMIGDNGSWGPTDVEPFSPLPDEPSFDESPFNEERWREKGTALAKRDKDVKWELGDWLVVGASYYGEDPPGSGEVIVGVRIPMPPDVYSVAEDITGLSRKTLQDLASTARRCPPSVRTEELSW
jgi:hypothetical protein